MNRKRSRETVGQGMSDTILQKVPKDPAPDFASRLILFFSSYVELQKRVCSSKEGDAMQTLTKRNDSDKVHMVVIVRHIGACCEGKTIGARLTDRWLTPRPEKAKRWGLCRNS